MDWRTMLTTFGVVFLAEMGDKTQIMAIGLAGRSGAPWSVLIGATLALALVTGLGVFGGAILFRYLPQSYLRIGSAVIFIVIGVALLLARD